MATTDISPFSWTENASADWMQAWQSLWRGAPQTLVQPILPGWTFNVNSNNSTAPQTEIEVLSKHSYGRQIGRISDALALLIEEQHGSAPEEKSFSDFLEMKHQIDVIKKDAAADRLEQIVKDMATLKAQDRAQYKRLREALLAALK